MGEPENYSREDFVKTMNVRILFFAIIGGVILTLLTGLIPNQQLMGATHYGYPFAWLIRLVIASQYFPWQIVVLNLVANIIVWVLIVSVILSILIKTGKLTGH
jgi:hypothetical protein